MLSPDDSFFFDQAAWRQPVRRYKKSIDELPQSLRYAHLNPKLASFYKDNKGGEEAVAETEGITYFFGLFYAYHLFCTLFLV